MSIQNTVVQSIELQGRMCVTTYSQVATSEYVGAPHKVVRAHVIVWGLPFCQGIDAIVMNPLVRGWSTHHFDLLCKV